MNPSEELAKRLAGRLRDLRQAAGLSQTELAKRLGATQNKATKIETGKTKPDASDIAAWAGATGADPEEIASLVALRAEIEEAEQTWAAKFKRKQRVTQREYDKMARESALVRNFETAAVPGLLQTYEYGYLRTLEGQRQGASPDTGEIEKSATARAKRGDVLYDQSRRFEFLIAEPVLHWRLAPTEVLKAQFARILVLSDLPNVSVSVLPYDADLRDTPQHGFILFDDLAVIETLSNEEKWRGDWQAEKYLSLFADFMALALHEADARRRISAAIEALA